MSETDPTYTVSFKSGDHYGAALLVARGDTSEELVDNIKALGDDLVQVMADKESEIRAARILLDNDPAPAASSQAQQNQGGGSGSDRYCTHGKRTRREGDGRKGPWVGYFCPLRKGDPNQCDPIFEDAD